METPYSQYRHIDDVDEQRIWLALMFTYKNHKLKESKFAYRWFAINFFKEMKHCSGSKYVSIVLDSKNSFVSFRENKNKELARIHMLNLNDIQGMVDIQEEFKRLTNNLDLYIVVSINNESAKAKLDEYISHHSELKVKYTAIQYYNNYNIHYHLIREEIDDV